MKKRNMVAGYYLASLMTGLLAAIALSLSVCSYAECEWLPLARLANLLRSGAANFLPIAIAVSGTIAVVLAVIALEGHGGKSWRTKMLQTLGFATFLVDIDVASSLIAMIMRGRAKMTVALVVAIAALFPILTLLKRVRIGGIIAKNRKRQFPLQEPAKI